MKLQDIKTVKDEQDYFIERGVATRTGKSFAIRKDKIKEWMKIDNDIRQEFGRRARKEYGIKMELRRLEQLSVDN